MAKRKSEPKDVPVIVTTSYRGVFFGLVSEADVESFKPNTAVAIRVKNARMCVYWPPENKSIIGLAVQGPLGGAKVSAPAPVALLSNVTAILFPSEEAVKRWESQPWG